MPRPRNKKIGPHDFQGPSRFRHSDVFILAVLREWPAEMGTLWAHVLNQICQDKEFCTFVFILCIITRMLKTKQRKIPKKLLLGPE